jgi:hypothetical protein
MSKSSFSIKIFFEIIILGYALQCKICEKNDSACLLGQDVQIGDCVSDNDLCYSWFDRSGKLNFVFLKFLYSLLLFHIGSQVGVQRDCISSDTAEYEAIKTAIGYKDSGCIKRVNGLDCFKFCSLDKCN